MRVLIWFLFQTVRGALTVGPGFKREISGYRRDPYLTSIAQDSGSTHPKCHEAKKTLFKCDCGAEFRIECGTDHVGGDMYGRGLYASSLDECVGACAERLDCVGVSWTDGQPRGVCNLKVSVGEVTLRPNVCRSCRITKCTTVVPSMKPSAYTTVHPSSYGPVPLESSSTAWYENNTKESTYNSRQLGPTVVLNSTQMSPSMGPTDDLNSQTDYLSSQTEYTNSPTDSSKSSTYYLNSPRDYPSLTDSPSPAPTFGNTTASTTFTSSCQNGNLSHILACTSTIKPKPTTASSTAPIATSECVPCGGQNGTLPYCGADINTDYYRFTPKTCRTVRYDFDITNTTITPDGVSRTALVVNGQMPGPAIEANWGDTIIVTVNNKLTDNGTSIHFHGIRQFNSNQYDGVPSITQCPIAPGESMTYRWIADSYGTSWYHSHFALQTWMGVFGPIIIHGPTAKGYDVDAGTVMLQDWSHKTVDSLFPAAQKNGTGGPQIMDNGLINGMNTWGSESAANSTGRRFEWDATVVPGQTYLLRIVNAAIQSTYKFYIDGHTLEVISMDFTPIKPYKTKILKISIGQRYEVLVKADQPVGDYWMRSDNQNACGAVTTQAKDIKGIIRYVGSAGGTPTSTAYSYTDECTDEPMISLAPILSLSPTNKALEIDYNVTFGVNDKNMFKWYLENSTFESKYSSPTLLSFLENSTAHTVSNNLFLDLPNAGEWIYIVLESALNLPHPIHLHGHDFFIMAQGSGTYSPSTPLQFKNPPRRDTALMPGGGFLVIAFVTENPGAWLLHCHIGWHQSMGFALQILEMKGEIRGVSEGVKGSVGVMQDVCEKWRNWEDGKGGQNLNSPI